jgi:uncharacterized short protein YbdD (DUF466 family)
VSALTGGDLWRGLRWYLREVSGESAYNRYVEQTRREHPHAPVLDRNAFERARQDRRDLDPPQRCC